MNCKKISDTQRAEKITCFLIGESGLLLECAALLLGSNFDIKGILSLNYTVHQWAIEHNIKIYMDKEEFWNILSNIKYDYLFSIINPRIIPQRILSTPSCLPINCHDAYLPYYRGVNSTSWAILNDAKFHGVTWHVMNAVVDGGGILAQEKIKIEEDDTAFSLDIKCHSKAMSILKYLIPDLLNKSCIITSNPINQGEYYSLIDKPTECGILIWEKESQLLYKEWRALNVSPLNYENRFCSPKCLVGDTFIIPYKFKITDEVSIYLPGTIAEICESSIKISTEDMNVELGEFVDADGNSLSINKLITKYKLKNGIRLFMPSEQDLVSVRKAFKDLSSEENKAYKLMRDSKACDFNVRNHNSKKAVAKKFLPELLKKIDIISSYYDVDRKSIFNTIILIYLYRLNNYEDFSVCISTKNVLRNDLENILFRNFIPANFSFSPDDKFNDILQKVKKQKIEMLKNKGYIRDLFQRYPDIREKKKIEDIIINNNEFQSTIPEECELYFNLVSDNHFYMYKTAKDNNGYFCSFAKYLNEHLLNLTSDIIDSNYNKLIHEIKFLSSLEIDVYHQLSKKEHACGYNNIFSLFKQQVELTPNNIALHGYGRKVTYSELMEAAESLSFILTEIAKDKKVIIILMSDKIDAIILILAILRIGKAYLPIDVNAPMKFLWSSIADIDSAIVISQKTLSEKFSNLEKKQSDFLEFFSYEDILERRVGHVTNQISYISSDGDSLAYIMFTSGTTGKQKGVKVCHKAIIRLVKNNGFLDIKSNDIIAGASNLAFDASTLEIWGTLLNGATLQVISHEDILNFPTFKRIIIENKITIMWLTAELFNHICDEDVMVFRYLKALLVGGDVVSAKNVKKVYTECGNNTLEIINGYGPTENTTFTTTYSIPRNIDEQSPLPIGRPISKTKILIMDRFRNLMPFNVKGELFIGGDGLFLGYANEPEITGSNMQKVILGESSDMYYKSGDYVMMSEENHLLYFLARKDNIKKIRGFRVNLHEIESVINAIDYIEQANVLMYENQNNNKQLIAFVKIKNRNKLDRELFQAQLAESLPRYAIPSRIIELTDTPITFSGKLDKRKLLDEVRADKEKSHDENSALENKLILIFSDLLGVLYLNKNDNFFDLGGHSLLVAKLITKIKEEFNYELKLWDFMRFPTVASIARLIKENINMVHDLSPMVIQDMKLKDSSIINNRNICMETPTAVFLTGATGFLGVHLLNELLVTTSYKIYCLVRSVSKSNAREKLKKSLNKYKLKVKDKVFEERIEIIVGDLELPYFGLNKNVFSELCQHIDIILHNGAKVHHLYGYELLRNANVLSTLMLLKMLKSGKKKHYYYISTLSAANENRDENNFIIEDFLKNDSMKFEFIDGYTLSKMVSENILAAARLDGDYVSIIRPGWILGQLETGICNFEKNHLSLFIKGCIQMQAIPSINARLNIIPVDMLSAIIVEIIQTRYNTPNVYNVINPYICTWDMIHKYIKSSGFSVVSMGYEKWLKDYLNQTVQDNSLFLFRPLYNTINMSLLEKQDKLYDAYYNNTKKIYEALGLWAVNMNEQILKGYFEHMKSSGFLTFAEEFADGYK